MRYQKILDRLAAGGYTREEIIRLRSNAQQKSQKGDMDARQVLDAIGRASPADRRVVFMGFCPSASFDNRMDLEWKEQGICTFIFHESHQQAARFADIFPGDLIVLKKRHVFGETMKLYGHGRVTGIEYDADGHRFLRMDWSAQDEVIEVPLMGANSTVDIRDMDRVEAEMPDAFFSWLGMPAK